MKALTFLNLAIYLLINSSISQSSQPINELLFSVEKLMSYNQHINHLRTFRSFVQGSIFDNIFSTNLLHSFQCGFLQSRLCFSCQHDNMHNIFHLRDSGQSINVVHFDFSVAFDKVSMINISYQNCLLLVFMKTNYLESKPFSSLDPKMRELVKSFRIRHPTLVELFRAVSWIPFYLEFGRWYI